MLQPINPLKAEKIWVICDVSLHRVGALYGQGEEWETCRPVTGARTATAVRTPFARFSAVYAPFSQPPDLTLDRLRREGFLHVFTSWKRIATRAGGLYRRGYPIPLPSNTRQPFRITLSRPSAFSIAFPRA